MEHYEKKISFLGENIQTIRKHRGMKQQELADKIGINMQSLSKIERGVNYPTAFMIRIRKSVQNIIRHLMKSAVGNGQKCNCVMIRLMLLP